MKKIVFLAFAVVAVLKLAAIADAHGGRRFSILVIDDKLYAQGYLSEIPDDGAGIERPYFNAIHGHFENSLIPSNQSAEATLPSYDIFEDTAMTLNGADVFLELLSAVKWENPTPQDTSLEGMARLQQDFEIPEMLPGLGPNDEPIFIGYEDEVISTSDLGRLTLAMGLSGAAVDLDLSYQIDDRPENILYVLEWQLSTTKSGIEASDSLYTIFSPDGNGPVERLHFQSLALENKFGVTISAVPEPGSFVALMLGTPLALIRRKRS